MVFFKYLRYILIILYLERLQGIDENRLEERININKMQILELQNKLKDSELENSHLSQVIMNPTYPFHRSYPSYNSYHV